MTTEKLQEILRKHTLWLNCDPGGEKADLSGVDLRRANLYRADLRGVDLSGTDLYKADLRRTDLRGVNLRYADLRNADLNSANLYRANLSSAILLKADLSGANLNGADLSGTNLRDANLYEVSLLKANMTDASLVNANLCRADLREANLIGANLSGADGLFSAVNFMKDNFERTEDGYIAYKTFGGQYTPPKKWKIKSGSIIEENVNFDRCSDCGCGINVAPIQWVKDNYTGDIWKVLIRWEWLAGVCVPYGSSGKIRCERVELIEIVK